MKSLADLEQVPSRSLADRFVGADFCAVRVVRAWTRLRKPIRFPEGFERYKDGGDSAESVQECWMREPGAGGGKQQGLMKLHRVDHVRDDEATREERRNEGANDGWHGQVRGPSGPDQLQERVGQSRILPGGGVYV